MSFIERRSDPSHSDEFYQKKKKRSLIRLKESPQNTKRLLPQDFRRVLLFLTTFLDACPIHENNRSFANFDCRYDEEVFSSNHFSSFFVVQQHRELEFLRHIWFEILVFDRVFRRNVHYSRKLWCPEKSRWKHREKIEKTNRKIDKRNGRTSRFESIEKKHNAMCRQRIKCQLKENRKESISFARRRHCCFFLTFKIFKVWFFAKPSLMIFALIQSMLQLLMLRSVNVLFTIKTRRIATLPS